MIDAILRAAEMVQRQGRQPHVLFMNRIDHEQMVDTFDYVTVEDTIRRMGGSYQVVSTRLGRLSVARRLSARHGRRFKALEWLQQ